MYLNERGPARVAVKRPDGPSGTTRCRNPAEDPVAAGWVGRCDLLPPAARILGNDCELVAGRVLSGSDQPRGPVHDSHAGDVGERTADTSRHCCGPRPMSEVL